MLDPKFVEAVGVQVDAVAEKEGARFEVTVTSIVETDGYDLSLPDVRPDLFSRGLPRELTFTKKAEKRITEVGQTEITIKGIEGSGILEAIEQVAGVKEGA